MSGDWKVQRVGSSSLTHCMILPTGKDAELGSGKITRLLAAVGHVDVAKKSLPRDDRNFLYIPDPEWIVFSIPVRAM